MDETTMKNANRLLQRFVSDTESKLRYGLRLRQAYFEAVQRGEDPKNYRTEFISNTSTEVFAWLTEKAREFNKKFPQDRMSGHDFLDILATAHHRLQEKLKKG